MGGLLGGGGAGEIDFDAREYADEANSFLDDALRTAIPISEAFTTRAISEVQRQFDIGRSDLKEYNALAQAQGAPYREAGYQALDMYQDTLGMPRLSSGSSAMAKALENKAKQQGAQRQLQSAASQFASQTNLPPAEQLKLSQMAQGGNSFALTNYLQNFLGQDPGTLKGPGSSSGGRFQDILDQSFGRQPSALSTFTSALGPLTSDLNKANFNLSSDQNSLAQFLTGGFGNAR